MWKLFVFVLTVVVLFAPGVPATEHSIKDLRGAYEDYDSGRLFVVAHRGCWAAAPENSVAAIEACIKMGVEAVEIDVQLTKDKKLIVFHDRTLDRMTDTWGYVSDKSFDEIRSLALMERDGSLAKLASRRFKTFHRIPTLKEVFEAARGKIMINLEIKANARAGYAETFEAAANLAREMGVADHVLWKIPPVRRGGDLSRADTNTRTFDVEGLPYVMPIVWQNQRPFIDQISDFSGLPVRGFEVVGQDVGYWPLMADGRISGADQFRYMGIAVLPQWSAGFADEGAMLAPDKNWGRLIDLRFDLIMTDRPEALISYLETKGLR